MVNSKGLVKLIELIIAIVIIMAILLVANRQNKPEQNAPDISELARDILKEIASNESLRNEILAAQIDTTQMIQTVSFIDISLPDYFNFELRACESSNACGQSSYVGDVYSAERIIGATTTTFNTVKLRLFIWVR